MPIMIAEIIASDFPTKDRSKVADLHDPLDAICSYYGIERRSNFSAYNPSEREEVLGGERYRFHMYLSKRVEDFYTFHLLLMTLKAIVDLWNSQRKPLRCTLDIQTQE